MHRCRGLVTAVLLCGCGVLVAFAAMASTETSIIIDGKSTEWGDRPIAGTDSVHDARDGCHELGSGYAFVNHHALYFLIETAGTDGACVQFDITIQADARQLLLSWSPGDDCAHIGDVTSEYEAIGDARLSSLALGPHLEARIDLRDVGSPEYVSLRSVHAMAGSCCDWPAWHACDQWTARGSTAVVDEKDPLDLSSGGIISAGDPFGLPEGWTWGMLMEPPAADITGIVRSEDGTIFVQHSGLSPAVSVLDPTTGKITCILELSPEDSTYRSIVEGPKDTTFVVIPSEDVVWQLSADGSHTLWGEATAGWPFAYTCDEYLLGRSHQGDLIKMFPDGSDALVSDRFSHIDSVVAIGDRLFVSDMAAGSIVRIDPDGSHHTLVRGVLYQDPMDMSADPQGNLYLNSAPTRFVTVNPETGALAQVPGSEISCTAHPADFVFASSSLVLFADPTVSQISWLDVTTQEYGILVSNEGANTWALAVGPDDAVYAGVSGCQESPARVMRYVPGEDDAQVYVDGLQGEIKDIAFDSSGGLYIATHDPEAGEGPTFYVPTSSQEPSRVWGVDHLYSLTVDPITNRAFGGDYHGELLLEFTPLGLWNVHLASLPTPAEDVILACAPDGTLYASCSGQENSDTGPVVERWILEFDLSSGQASIFAQKDWHGCCVMLNCCVGPHGSLWWLLNPDFLLYKIAERGDGLELFAQSLPIDPAAVAVDRHGNVYVASPSGILRFSPPETVP